MHSALVFDLLHDLMLDFSGMVHFDELHEQGVPRKTDMLHMLLSRWLWHPS